MINAVDHITRQSFKDRMDVINGANITRVLQNFAGAIPPRDDSITDSLPGIFNLLEMDEHLALLAPTYLHSRDPTPRTFHVPPPWGGK